MNNIDDSVWRSMRESEMGALKLAGFDQLFDPESEDCRNPGDEIIDYNDIRGK